MAQFKYTLPSGAEFQLDAPNGTTQAQADAIFYGQVAAGTFVGYNVGDTLTSAEEALNNFGITRLERGTAGVDDKALLAITAGLPVVTQLPPTVTTAAVENPVDVASYILVSSNPNVGLIDQGPNELGGLSKSAMTGLLATLGEVQDFNVLSMLGVGKYGFNGPQLIRVGYIKAIYETNFAVDPITQANPPDFITLMNSPSVWTGPPQVSSVDEILNNEALQNRIQEMLLNQSYNELVESRDITPPSPTTTVPVTSIGQVYDPTGQMISAPPIALLTSSPVNSVAESGTALGNSTGNIASLGPSAVAALQAGQTSLSTGAVNFSGSQVSGLAAGSSAGALAATAALLASRVTGDIGALVANASKFGPALTSAWAKGTDIFGKIGSTNYADLAKTGIAKVGDAAKGAVTNLAGTAQSQLSAAIAGPTGAAMAELGKASQLATNVGTQMAGLVSRVEKAPAFTNTVDRKTIDAATTRVIGSAKVSSPTYELPSAESLGNMADIEQAKSLLAQAGSSAQNLGNQAVAVVGEARNTVSQNQGLGPNLFG